MKTVIGTINGYDLETGFTQDQKKEIREGFLAGLDVSVYARPEFLAIQMREIRLGLQECLPVYQYADSRYDWFQMNEIRKGLVKKLDVGKYANPSIPFDVMCEIRCGLEDGIDLSRGKNMPAGILHEIRSSVKSKVDIMPYIKQGYEEEQLKQIRISLEKGVDIAPYLSLSYRGASIREICIGLEKKIDVSVYAKTDMSWQQMREIRLGLERRLDVSEYLNTFYSWQQMREIRLGLEEDLQIDTYKSLMYTAKEMKKKRLKLLKDWKRKNSTNELHTISDGQTEKYSAFSLVVSSDAMEAMVVLADTNTRVECDEILSALKKSGVTHGIDYIAVRQLGEGKAENTIVVVARGKQPEKGKDGWYEFFFERDIKSAPKLLDDGSVDYQNIKWFEMVQAAQKVAVYHPAVEGENGWRVTGEIIHSHKGKEKKMLSGKGFILLPDKVTYIAEADGKIDYNDGKLEISNVLILDDVISNSGNIDFNGSVYIRGTVGMGTTVRAEKDILVEGFTESAVLEAGRDIILKKGNNAGGNGYLKAGRDVYGSFFENTKVTAGNDIKTNYCLNSELYAGNLIEINGKNGTLAGGNAYAAMSVKAFHIGNDAGIITKIKLGNYSSFAYEIAQLADRMEVVNNELLMLKNACHDFQQKYSVEQRNGNAVYQKIIDAIYTKEMEAGRLYKRNVQLENDRKKSDRAKAVVRGTIFPGTIIDINGVIWNAELVKNVSVKNIAGRISVHSNF